MVSLLGFQWKTQHFHSLGRRGWNYHLRKQIDKFKSPIKIGIFMFSPKMYYGSAEGHRTEAIVSGKWICSSMEKIRRNMRPLRHSCVQHIRIQELLRTTSWSTEGKKGLAVLIFTDHLPLSGPCSLQKNNFADIIKKYIKMAAEIETCSQCQVSWLARSEMESRLTK